MSKIMDSLLALQSLQFDPRARTADSQVKVEKLRVEVPSPILGHYERLVARGKKGVAVAQHGVCGECHLRITEGKLIKLSTSVEEVHLCDNCGRYLYLPATETVLVTESKPRGVTPAKKRSRKAAPQVV